MLCLTLCKKHKTLPPLLSCPSIFLLLEEREPLCSTLSSQLSGQLMLSKAEKLQRLFSVTCCESPFNSSLGNFCSRATTSCLYCSECVFPRWQNPPDLFLLLDTRNNFFYQKMNMHSRPTFTGIFKLLPFYLISYPWRCFTRGLQQSQKTFLLTDHYKGMRRNIFPS